MGSDRNQVLPYRTDANDLTRLVEAYEKGRSWRRIQVLNLTSDRFQGALAAAHCLKLIDENSGNITERGERFALSSCGVKRRRLLLEAIIDYEPYELLLEAVFVENFTGETSTQWIENWWNTWNYGSSSCNRSDGALAFAKFVEYVAKGKFYVGRRGRPSRIEWYEDAKQILENARSSFAREADSHVPGEPTSQIESPETAAVQAASAQVETVDASSSNSSEVSSLTLGLGSGRVAKLTVPARLTQSEKQRLMDLVELMIAVEPED